MYPVRELLARLIKCEAGGEGDIGMKAVASVVMNRVHVAEGEYMRINQGDLRKVITQPGEFSCLLPIIAGETNPQTIWSNPPENIHYEIADWALSGSRLAASGESLWFMNPFVPDCPQYFPYNMTGVIFNRIFQHCFFTPTELYYQT